MTRIAVSGRVTTDRNWKPSLLGTSFIARPPKVGFTDRVTLSGTNILTLTNDGGIIPGTMSSTAGQYCTLDSSIPQNGYAAIRTVADTSDLKTASGGPGGASQFHQIVLALSISQPNGATSHNDSCYMLSGDPGNDATHKNFGIGSTSTINGAWIRAGGFQNPLATGGALPRMTFTTDLHLFEATSDGTNIIAKRDGGRLGLFAGATSLSSGAMGFRGTYPLGTYGPPDTMIYWAGWFGRVLTTAELTLLYDYIKTEFVFTPKRYIQTIGDSITAGHIGGVNTTSYLEYMVSQYAALTTPEIIYSNNTGITSQTTAQILARVDATYMASFAPPGFREQWLVIGGRTNDPGAGISVAQSYANLSAINTIAQAAGIRTCIITVIPAVSMSAQDIIDYNAFNALVTANSAGFDRVADLSPIFPAVPTTTFYLPDTVHPSDAVTASMATIIRAAIG